MFEKGQCTTAAAAAYQIGDSRLHGLHGTKEECWWWKIGGDWWSCIRLSDLGQEHNCTTEQAVWHLARHRNSHFFLRLGENSQTGNFFQKYISLSQERNRFCRAQNRLFCRSMKRSAPPAGASIGARGCSRVIYFLEKGSYVLSAKSNVLLCVSSTMECFGSGVYVLCAV